MLVYVFDVARIFQRLNDRYIPSIHFVPRVKFQTTETEMGGEGGLTRLS